MSSCPSNGKARTANDLEGDTISLRSALPMGFEEAAATIMQPMTLTLVSLSFNVALSPATICAAAGLAIR